MRRLFNCVIKPGPGRPTRSAAVASPEELGADIDAAVAVLGERLDAAEVQSVRDNAVQRVETIAAMLESTEGCLE